MYCSTCRGVTNEETYENIGREFTQDEQLNPANYPQNFQQIDDWVVTEPSGADLTNVCDFSCPECGGDVDVDSMVVNTITVQAEEEPQNNDNQPENDNIDMDMLAQLFVHLGMHVDHQESTRCPSDADVLEFYEFDDSDLELDAASDTGATVGDFEPMNFGSELDPADWEDPGQVRRRLRTKTSVTRITSPLPKHRRRTKGPE